MPGHQTFVRSRCFIFTSPLCPSWPNSFTLPLSFFGTTILVHLQCSIAQANITLKIHMAATGEPIVQFLLKARTVWNKWIQEVCDQSIVQILFHKDKHGISHKLTQVPMPPFQFVNNVAPPEKVLYWHNKLPGSLHCALEPKLPPDPLGLQQQ